MGRLTTHVLDTSTGKPAEGVRIELFRLDGDDRLALCEKTTNSDGRCDAALLQGDDFRCGEYELVFHVGPYFTALGLTADEPRFLNVVPIRFGIADGDAHYHVPLLISPYGYSTYRGS